MVQENLVEDQNLEQELLVSFEIEELEKRYEMGWMSSGDIYPKLPQDFSTFDSTVTIRF